MRAREEDLFRRETALAGFQTVLGPGRFAVALQEGLRARGQKVLVGQAKLMYLRYKPLTNCLVSYLLELNGAPHFVHATAHRADETAKMSKALKTYGDESLHPPVILPDQIVVRFFPTDRKLKALSRVTDALHRAELLKRALPKFPELWDADIDILRYKPERRLVARLRAPGGQQALLKLYHDGDVERAAAGARAFSSGARFRTARLLGALDDQHLFVWSWLDARPFDACLHEAPEGTAQVGAALAALHQGDAPTSSDMSGLHAVSRTEEAKPLHAAANAVAFLLPALADRAQKLAGALAAALAAAPALRRPVHGDFSADQVLLDEHGVSIIDFDAAAQGDPAWDLGTFAAQLERNALRGDLPWSSVTHSLDALHAGYEAASGMLPARVELYTAAGLLRLAPHAFRSRAADWPEQTEALLERAEALLGGSRGPSSSSGTPGVAPGVAAVRVTDPYDLHADGVLGASGAVQANTVGAALKPLLAGGGFGNPRLQAITVLRHRPGRRALIAYDLAYGSEVDPADVSAGAQGLRVLGKVRAKGADRKTDRLQRALWEHGFGDNSEDGIGVPQPLGIVPDLKLTLQRAVPGETLEGYLTGPESLPLMRRVAEAAHKLHEVFRSANPPEEAAPRRVHTLEDELSVLRAQLGRVAEKKPAWGGRLRRLLAACEGLAARLPVTPPTGIHRDFYHDQLLWEPTTGRLYLLDLDLYCLGDPALDIGNFAAHLREWALRHGDASALDAQIAALTAHFCALSGTPPAAIAGYHDLSLVRHIAISQRLVARRPFTEALLALCEARLGVQGGAQAAGAYTTLGEPAR